jgi:hypothetical protein
MIISKIGSAETDPGIYVIGSWVFRGNGLDAMMERKISPVLEMGAVLHTIV